ncbi:hypothetical protein L596_009928 [Steinernema carpocapsae]|uniref:Uncharacterized protein n=1 Tax=Steinernema carpocapsae TaxID=34508 RepID=A0A4U5PH00_STECR|nr:hypothetical protein L596_009928 [Steinernema carpocapsae]
MVFDKQEKLTELYCKKGNTKNGQEYTVAVTNEDVNKMFPVWLKNEKETIFCCTWDKNKLKIMLVDNLSKIDLLIFQLTANSETKDFTYLQNFKNKQTVLFVHQSRQQIARKYHKSPSQRDTSHFSSFFECTDRAHFRDTRVLKDVDHDSVVKIARNCIRIAQYGKVQIRQKIILQVVKRSRRDYPAQTTMGYNENGVMWPLVECFVFNALWGRIQPEIHSKSYKKLHNRKEKRQF